jgi:MoxR-like ATPase
MASVLPPPHDRAQLALREAIAVASRGLVERTIVSELVVLAAVAGEHLLIVGPPGTAKSEAVRRVSRTLGGVSFEYLLGRFTEPSELFGAVDLARLREGRVETDTTGMLPEAEIAFLDEVFLGSTAILNTLLGILNERTFRRGHTVMKCPLRVCVGASNALPEDTSLDAFADRFMLRLFVEPISDARLEDMLEAAWSLGKSPMPHVAAIDDVDALAKLARAADLSAVRPLLVHALRLLREAGIHVTDRRAARMQYLVAAAAVLGGRMTPTARDLWPIVFAVPTAEQQRLARDVLREPLAEAENAALKAAAEDASGGPLARATRLLSASNDALEKLSALAGAEGDERTRAALEVEAIAREITASFDDATMPPELREARARIEAALSEGG